MQLTYGHMQILYDLLLQQEKEIIALTAWKEAGEKEISLLRGLIENYRALDEARQAAADREDDHTIAELQRTIRGVA